MVRAPLFLDLTEQSTANTEERLLDTLLLELTGHACTPALLLEDLKAVFSAAAPAGYEVVGVTGEDVENAIENKDITIH